ncbi:MAG: tetratricopeptide repeat protein [Gracilibacteraceae bacterium]|nr:tetratricopeptide repeat protein [Gracilibacteraceae bacterium]
MREGKMGKRLLRFVFIGLLLLVAACGQKALTYEEQIDLGQRFLEDGDYEQAIVAFTAAIQIEPKLSPAYVGLADAHKGLGQPEEAVAAIRQGVEAIGDVSSSGDLIVWAEIFGDEAFASGDYDTAILAYDTLVFADPQSEYFQKLADAYVAAGDVDSAIETLRKGYNYTGDAALAARLEELEADETLGVYLGTYTVVGTITAGSYDDEKYQSYAAQYEGVGYRVGVRFAETITLPSGETISGAGYDAPDNMESYYMEQYRDQATMMTGRLYFDENSSEFELYPEYDEYSYNPWWPYRFEVLSVE